MSEEAALKSWSRCDTPPCCKDRELENANVADRRQVAATAHQVALLGLMDEFGEAASGKAPVNLRSQRLQQRALQSS